MLSLRSSPLTKKYLMLFAGIPIQELRRACASQELILEGWPEGEDQGEARGGVAEALLDLTGPGDLAGWLADYNGRFAV